LKLVTGQLEASDLDFQSDFALANHLLAGPFPAIRLVDRQAREYLAAKYRQFFLGDLRFVPASLYDQFPHKRPIFLVQTPSVKPAAETANRHVRRSDAAPGEPLDRLVVRVLRIVVKQVLLEFARQPLQFR